MLLTLELILLQDPKRTLCTVGEVNISYGPELKEAINGYLMQNASTPPGIWTREYKGQQYITQSVPSLPFFLFLKSYELVPIIGEFLAKNFDFAQPSKCTHPDASFNAWVSMPTGFESVAIAMQLTA
ncbi:TPA: hypothetical protein PXJ82_004123 [Yersinia enterocolitica]|nr:hypothetical protein [Yersinia enterocolitica]HDM8344711.1 hypothetical protein [Yersinia enterocolitica]HEN3438258.1 hypothetical protein [Yersinia enterocolitica]